MFHSILGRSLELSLLSGFAQSQFQLMYSISIFERVFLKVESLNDCMVGSGIRISAGGNGNTSPVKRRFLELMQRKHYGVADLIYKTIHSRH